MRERFASSLPRQADVTLTTVRAVLCNTLQGTWDLGRALNSVVL